MRVSEFLCKEDIERKPLFAGTTIMLTPITEGTAMELILCNNRFIYLCGRNYLQELVVISLLNALQLHLQLVATLNGALA